MYVTFITQQNLQPNRISWDNFVQTKLFIAPEILSSFPLDFLFDTVSFYTDTFASLASFFRDSFLLLLLKLCFSTVHTEVRIGESNRAAFRSPNAHVCVCCHISTFAIPIAAAVDDDSWLCFHALTQEYKNRQSSIAATPIH